MNTCVINYVFIPHINICLLIYTHLYKKNVQILLQLAFMHLVDGNQISTKYDTKIIHICIPMSSTILFSIIKHKF